MARRGLDGRGRDQNGQIREKRADTKVSTLRKEYGDSFLPGVNGNTHLGTVRDEKGGESLSQMLKDKK